MNEGPVERKHHEIIIKFATSLDGCFDDTSPARVIFSGPNDARAVDVLRASCDAILVGAETIRRDDPRLVIKDDELRHARAREGRPENPLKISLTRSGRLSLDAQFFSAGDAPRLIYTSGMRSLSLANHLGQRAEVVACGETSVDLSAMFADLYKRQIRKILVEGGPALIGECLKLGLPDRFRIAVSARLIGEANAPRLFSELAAPQSCSMVVERVERLDELCVISGRFSKSTI